MKMLTLDKFEEASEKVKEVTLETKLVYSDYLSDQTGNKVYLKPENMQFTGAYKVRGAYYKISTLSEEERQRGLITASAGNHAQGVAYAAKCYGCKAVIVMPTTTPLIKVNRTKSYGAEVVLYGDVYDEACAHALELAEKNGYTFIHPFDDLAVATGQGTIAMEIFKELPLVEYILVPIGGGGLATGVSTLAKLLNPKIKVIGVEPEGANCMQESLKTGEVVSDMANAEQYRANIKMDNIHVGGSAQTTAALGVNVRPMKGLRLSLDWNFFARNYAGYDIDAGQAGMGNEYVVTEPWEIPSYHTFDLSAGYSFDFGKVRATLSGNVNNLLDQEYIADARDGSKHDWETATRVLYGFGRTYSVRLKFNF